MASIQLKNHPFFRESDPETVAPLIERAEESTYEQGEVIFREGEPSDWLCLVLEGTVSFAKTLPNGEQRIVSKSSAGRFFGEVGIFTGAPRSLSAIAETRVQLAKIRREELVHFIKNTPGPVEQILGSIINHLHGTTQHYIQDMLHQEKMTVVGKMVSTIIHDFKNPFTLISLGAQMLLTEHQDPKTQKICKNIDDQVRRMVEMANEIIEFSRGDPTLELTEFNLQDLFTRFKELNEPFFHKKNITIEMTTEPVRLTAEPAKLMRVLQNLISNALEALEDPDFSPSRPGRIVVHGKDCGDTVEITVADNGNGIPEAIRDTLFQPFTTYGKSRGTGLGTAIVKSLVEAHGGTIRFETESGKGTTFFIHLPKRVAS